MSELFLTIKTGCENDFEYGYPRQYIFSYEIKPTTDIKYIGFQICIRNDESAENARTIYFYYVSDPKYFVDMFKMINREFVTDSYNDDDNQIQCGLMSSAGIWIDEWVRRRNGDLYRLYEYNKFVDSESHCLSNDDTDYIYHKIIINIMLNLSNKIRSRDEENFISEKKMCKLIETHLEAKIYKFKIYGTGRVEVIE